MRHGNAATASFFVILIQRPCAAPSKDIYPSRYGSWDDGIETYLSDNAPTGNFDLIVIGTPPDTHISLALDAVSERPQAILIEKPFRLLLWMDAKSLLRKPKEMALNCLSDTIMCSERRRRQSKIGLLRKSLAMCRASTLNFVNSGVVFLPHTHGSKGLMTVI